MRTRFQKERKRYPSSRIAVVACAGIIAVCACRSTGTVPLVEGDSALRTRGENTVKWVIDAADNALSMGYSTVAVRLYLDAISSGFIGPEQRGAAILGAASALISTGEYARAEELLADYPDEENAAFVLRDALAKYYRGNWEAAQGALRLIPVSDLSKADHAWYFLLSGLLQEALRNFEGAEIFFEKAMESSLSSAQRAQFEAVLFRLRLLSGLPNNVDESLAGDLRARLEATRGQAVGFQHAKVYAVVLNNLGRSAR